MKINIEKQKEYISLAKYLQQLLSLNIHVQGGEFAPHKPIMILAISNLIAKGEISENKIAPSDSLKDEFERLWNLYVSVDSQYEPRVWTPYWHLKKEPFWHFEPISSHSAIDALVPAGQTASIGKIRDNIKYAYLDEPLFLLFKKPEFADLIKEAVIETYLK